MTPLRDIIPPEVVFFGLFGMCVVLLWQIARLLEGIRNILADIASATRAAPDRSISVYGLRDTNRLLKLAIKKQWGSAIDLEDL
jgi:hypothetical protein